MFDLLMSDCIVSSSITFANLLLIFSGVGVSRFPSVSLLLLCRLTPNPKNKS
ncbi:hypothetical protein Hanom_Chr16g01463251 [Helianthus anomalus]